MAEIITSVILYFLIVLLLGFVYLWILWLIGDIADP
jgi:hypothetical protein